MKRIWTTICIFLVLATLFSFVYAVEEPQQVPRQTERALDRASYIELARQWKAYIETHGESARALVNLAMAYDYSGEEKAARRAAERAVKIAPDSPEALSLLAKLCSRNRDELQKALALLKQIQVIAHDYIPALTYLAAVQLKLGELDKASETCRAILEQDTLSRPLQDYAYNMLAGLPDSAVLVTNGDLDTFPSLALQVGKGFRTDVIVINRSLLNLEEYNTALFSKYPSIRPRGLFVPEKSLSLSSTLIKRMIQKKNVSVYLATSVNIDDLGFNPTLTIEGINYRVSGNGLPPEESARLFIDTYRLDSATEWAFGWDLVPSVKKLMQNYVYAMIKVSENKSIRADTKKILLKKSWEIAEFHAMDNARATIEAMMAHE